MEITIRRHLQAQRNDPEVGMIDTI
jgi:hypothetical protein